MKIYLLLVSLFVYISNVSSQEFKRQLDTTAFNNWEYVSNATRPKISNNGKFAGFISQYGNPINYANPKSLTVKSINGEWAQKFGPGIVEYDFSTDSKILMILNAKGVFETYELGTGRLIQSINASGFTRYEIGNSDCIILSLPGNQVYIKNLRNNTEIVFSDVKSYYQSDLKNRLFLVYNNDRVSYVNMPSIKENYIGQFTGISNLTINKDANMFAYMTNDTIQVWDIKGRMISLINNAVITDSNLYISNIDRFSTKSNSLFIYLEERVAKPVYNANAVKVKVWNYKDSRLRTDPGKIGLPQNFLFSVDLKNNSLTRIQQPFEEIRFLSEQNTDLIKVTFNKGSETERHWNKEAQAQHFIFNCSTRRRTKVNMQPEFLSPDDKYVIGFDSLGVNVKVWDMLTNVEKDLTERLNRIPSQYGVSGNDLQSWKFQGWAGSHTLILSDGCDIWNIDVSNPFQAINRTNDYGKRNNISFIMPKFSREHIFDKDDLSIVICFDNNNKSNGFYELSENNAKDPKKLIMSDAAYSWYYVKARNANVSIVQRERVDNSPNFYTTIDFKKFEPLSALYPERKYKWLNSELFTFQTADGKRSQAIIYKPEDFDSTKIYPVIVYCYEKFSDELHHYIYPEAATGDLNIPWFVSKDYIVIKPDIHYTLQHAHESALATVKGLINQLSYFRYIDTARCGIIGISWGAEEVNYIVAHTNIFKCAVSSSGQSNLISAVTSLQIGGSNFVDLATFTRYQRFNRTLWERPDLYIDNSAIISADKINTPILLMANEKDAIVNVEQGVSFFWALRRLGKPAWLLQYQDEVHTLFKEENKIDFSYKTLNFFDHFLKSNPLPKWMNEPL